VGLVRLVGLRFIEELVIQEIKQKIIYLLHMHKVVGRKAHVVVKGFDHNKLANRNHDYLPQ
jgi:hypothetical protein